MAIHKVVDRYRIHIVEHDRWSGPTTIDKFDVDSFDEAEKFCDDYNSRSCPPLKPGESVPDYYISAEIKGKA